ncbi:hypothetical protein P3387_26510, partial [Vibrio parahaemolyticus]|nr:hypothetical protein [Vibrio parahaemolyticus]
QILCVALRFFANGSFLYNVGDAEHLSKATVHVYAGRSEKCAPFTGICLLSVGCVEVCVSLNRLNYLTEHDIDEKTFMCVKTALCWG